MVRELCANNSSTHGGPVVDECRACASCLIARPALPLLLNPAAHAGSKLAGDVFASFHRQSTPPREAASNMAS
jgi:hypothetical protein